MSLKIDRFTDKLYDEFEQKLFRVFGYSIEDLKTVLDRPDTTEREGHDLEQELKKELGLVFN